MKIEIVQLENIRSHVKSTVPLTSGFNCLVGGLGCGKSSILYAVDFALFGEAIGRSFEYLLREGEDWGRVTVQFTQNGSTYKLTRGLKRKGKSINQNFEELKLYEDEKLVASMKTDAISEQFKAITGLDKDLYREIVWFKQEHLKELLDAPPRDRQRRLDELFGLSDYEVAWSSIAQYQRDYETEKRIYEKDPDVLGLEKLGNEYNKATEEFALLEMGLEDSAQKLGIAKKALDEADFKLKNLEERRQASEELKRKEARLHSDITNMTNTITSLTKHTKDKKTVLDNLRQRQASNDAQMQTCLSKLEEAGLSSKKIDLLHSSLSELDDKVSCLRADLEATTRSLQTDKKRFDQLGQENKCPLCVQPLEGEYKTSLLSRIQQENVEREKTIQQLRLEIERRQKTRATTSEAFATLQTCMTRAEELKTRAEEEEINLKKLLEEVEAKAAVACGFRCAT